MAIVLTMLGVSTTHSILSLHSFILQGLKLGPDPPNMIQRLLSYDLTFTCLARLNVGCILSYPSLFVSDAFVICSVLSKRLDCCVESVGIMAR